MEEAYTLAGIYIMYNFRLEFLISEAIAILVSIVKRALRYSSLMHLLRLYLAARFLL